MPASIPVSMLLFPCSFQLTTSKEYKSPLIPLQLGLLQWCLCWCWSVPLSTSITALAGADHHSVKANAGWGKPVPIIAAELFRKIFINGCIGDWECCWPWQRAARVCFLIPCISWWTRRAYFAYQEISCEVLYLFDHFHCKGSARSKMLFHLVRSSKLLNFLIWCQTRRRSRDTLLYQLPRVKYDTLFHDPILYITCWTKLLINLFTLKQT